LEKKESIGNDVKRSTVVGKTKLYTNYLAEMHRRGKKKEDPGTNVIKADKIRERIPLKEIVLGFKKLAKGAHGPWGKSLTANGRRDEPSSQAPKTPRLQRGETPQGQRGERDCPSWLKGV